jgi:hypothetical protein
MLYLVYAESANYAGYGQHFVVEAPNAGEVEALVSDDIEDYFYEQDSDQLKEELAEEEWEAIDTYGSIERVEEFGPEHEQWKYYQDPTQAEFYWKVNV